METRFVIVCYDIPDTVVRNRLIHVLFSWGLSRIQYSVFCGVIPVPRIPRITEQIRTQFSDNEDKILIVPLCRTCVSQLTRIHMAFATEPRTFLVV